MGNLALGFGSVTTIMDEVLVSGSGSVAYSDPFTIEGDQNFSVFMVASGSSPHLRVDKCYNPDDNDPPDPTMWAEHDEDGNYNTFIDDFSQKTWSIVPLIVNYSVWARFKCTGLATNGADTKLTVKLVKQSAK